jgi:excisionase family DNA binding protein
MREIRVPVGFDEPSYSVGEFAGAVGVHRTTVRRWVNRGLVAHWLTPTGRVRIPQSAVDASITVHAASAQAA